MKKIFITLAAIATLISCQKGEMPESNDLQVIDFRFELPATKATATSFESGDVVSLYAVEYNSQEAPELQLGGNFLNNEKLTYNGTAWETSRKVYWSSKPCDFYAIYPARRLTSVENHYFEIVPDQHSVVEGTTITGYEASDVLYAKAENVVRPDNNELAMTFSHLLSKCIVTITKGEKFEGEIPDDIVTHIYSTCTSAILNLSKGSVEKDAQGNRKTITMKKLSNERFEAIVVPQNVERRTPLIEVTMGGIAYLLEYSLSFKPGHVHTINLIVNTSPDQENFEISIDPSIEDMQ